MYTYGNTFYVCEEGCFYNWDKVPGHSQKVRCFPCDAAVYLATKIGIIWESLPIRKHELFCCPRGSVTSEEAMDTFVLVMCEDCLADGEEEEEEEEGV